MLTGRNGDSSNGRTEEGVLVTGRIEAAQPIEHIQILTKSAAGLLVIPYHVLQWRLYWTIVLDDCIEDWRDVRDVQVL
jgi:hypothetical protein